VIFSSSKQVFDGSNFLLVNNFDTSFQWNYFTISAWIKASTSPTTFSSIVSLGRSPTNFNGQFVFSISNQKLSFFDGSDESLLGWGFLGSGKTVLSSGKIFFLNSLRIFYTLQSKYQASNIMSHLSKTDCLLNFT
jgi:hypothetical protein